MTKENDTPAPYHLPAARDYAAVLRRIHASADELLKILELSDAHIVGSLTKAEHSNALLSIKNHAALLATAIEDAIREAALEKKSPQA